MSNTGSPEDTLMAAMMSYAVDAASKEMAELEKDATFAALPAESKDRKRRELLSKKLNEFLDHGRTFVHHNRAGYFMDKVVAAGTTVLVAAATTFALVKLFGKPAQTEVAKPEADGGATQVPLFNTGPDKASDRPIRSSRELKAAV